MLPSLLFLEVIFFSTWANRFDSDMPPIDCEPIVNGDHHYIDDELMVCIHTPGFALEGFSFYFENKGVCVAPSVIHRADLPIRWNLPGGQISELHDSIEELLSLELETLVPSKGPSIKGRGHIVEVLNRHLDFLSEVIDNEGELLRGWKRPVPTAMYFSLQVLGHWMKLRIVSISSDYHLSFLSSWFDNRIYKF